MPEISVIVPVYNVKEYLSECMDSILQQTFDDMEIICVDDGSSDGSESILDDYARKDSRVHVLHRENAGYGAAMNAGVEIASGKYIGIVESDDCILPDMYEKLYKAAEDNEADLVKADAYYWFEKCGYQKRIHMKQLDRFYDRLLGDNDRNVFFEFLMNIWTGIYKRDFLDKYEIRFHESPGAAYQDNGFWMQTMMYAERAMWLNEAFYLYRNDNPAASVKNLDKVYAMTREYDYLEALLLQRQEYHLLPYCYYMRLIRDRGTVMRIADSYKRGYCEQIKRDFHKCKSAARGDRGLLASLLKYVEDADAACSDMISAKNRLREKLGSCGQIIIYGAGFRGDIVFRILYNEGFYDKLACFAVTHCDGESRLAGKAVMDIDEAVKCYSESIVVIAVVRGTKAYEQMRRKLEEIGCFNYIAGTDLEENFYVL